MHLVDPMSETARPRGFLPSSRASAGGESSGGRTRSALSCCVLLAGMACLSSVPLQAGVGGGADVTFRLGTARALNTEQAQIRVSSTSDVDLNGAVLAFQWDGRKAFAVDVARGTQTMDADVFEARIERGSIVLGIVPDMDGSGGEVIPAGPDAHLATVTMQCDCPGEQQDIILAFVDGQHALSDDGSLLDNMAMVGQTVVDQSSGLSLENGLLICNSPGNPPPPPPSETGFTCGGELQADGSLGPLQGNPGEMVDVCFYYTDPEAEGGGRIQGFSMAVRYDCGLTCNEPADTQTAIAGGVLADVEVEFFTFHCDNDATDDDGCELVAGALLDVDAPNDGRTLPAQDGYALLFCVEFEIDAGATPGTCLPIDFVNGVNGRGEVATDNLVSIDFFEQIPALSNCEVCVGEPGGGGDGFIRGDCNFNNSVNIADASAQVGAFFLAGDQRFNAPCDDACDANDDGDLNITDVVYLLNYLFIPGNPQPPAPFPERGDDPTADALTCAAG